MRPIHKSNKLLNVCYDIRGPVLEEARRLEEEGHRIIKLNIGNLAPFGFAAPDEIVRDMMRNLDASAGYSDSKGIFSARTAVMHYAQQKGIAGVELDDIYLGNGVSELIVMSMQALLNNHDEVLLPAPDYPLWTAAVSLAGGTPVHYLCDEQNGWLPDLDDMRAKITANTRALVIINPNNPTGALYPEDFLKAVVELARQHDLIVLADEIYDKVIYDDLSHTSIAALSKDVLTITFNGLSKNYRACGYRVGWMILSGLSEPLLRQRARDYIEGLNILASMRLCPNVPGQYAIQTALGGHQSIQDLTAPGGRLFKQRALAYEMLSAIPGVSCVKPKAALYLFPRLDPALYPIQDDQRFISELLLETRVLVVQGTGFNWPTPDHFRVVFLPNLDDLREAIERIAQFLDKYRKQYKR
ncbi:pyridoxal phosphate-dependent aminotransferase [Mycoavidus sp. B2-EB]|uniref:pyridoxal phosphate-dependent aminotransferase n=1 Tax=Mycoavidus sp. B2-EB TaxID=2651972 RepID=UPI001625E0FF|nr:pyridoxal phosphate-dependent aminotransferase [Mycoavidus sp. B2-EB]BBO59273.1 aminotransferase [Mycoavidus sp. B2-EB]